MCGYSGRSIRFKAYLGVQNHILFDRNRRKKIHRKLPYHSRNKEKNSCRSVEGGAQQDGGVGGDRQHRWPTGLFTQGKKVCSYPPDDGRMTSWVRRDAHFVTGCWRRFCDAYLPLETLFIQCMSGIFSSAAFVLQSHLRRVLLGGARHGCRLG